MNFGEKLKKIREAKKLTQKELALKLGVTQRTISYYENSDSNPTNIKFLTDLTNILEIAIDDLLDSDEEKNNSKIHKLVAKLLTDTVNHRLKWQSSVDSLINPFIDDNDNNYYLNFFFSGNFYFLKNADCDFKNSYIAPYRDGAYLVLKYTTLKETEPSINFALFIFSDQTNEYYYIVNNNSLETLEDLYLSIANVNSPVDDFIDVYLKDNFQDTEKEPSF